VKDIFSLILCVSLSSFVPLTHFLKGMVGKASFKLTLCFFLKLQPIIKTFSSVLLLILYFLIPKRAVFFFLHFEISESLRFVTFDGVC